MVTTAFCEGVRKASRSPCLWRDTEPKDDSLPGVGGHGHLLTQAGSGGSRAVTHHGLLVCEGTQAWNTHCGTTVLCRDTHLVTNSTLCQAVRGNEAWNRHHGCVCQLVRGHHGSHSVAVPGLWGSTRVVKHTMAVPGLWGTLAQHGAVKSQLWRVLLTDCHRPSSFSAAEEAGREGRAALCAAGSVGKGNGCPRDGLQPPSSTTGPFCKASSSPGAAGQPLSVAPEEKERVVQGFTDKGEGCRKPSEDEEEAMLFLLLPFFHPQCFHTGCCQSHRLFPGESWVSCPEWIDLSFRSSLSLLPPLWFLGQKSTFLSILLFLRYFRDNRGSDEHFLLAELLPLVLPDEL